MQFLANFRPGGPWSSLPFFDLFSRGGNFTFYRKLFLSVSPTSTAPFSSALRNLKLLLFPTVVVLDVDSFSSLYVRRAFCRPFFVSRLRCWPRCRNGVLVQFSLSVDKFGRLPSFSPELLCWLVFFFPFFVHNRTCFPSFKVFPLFTLVPIYPLPFVFE